MDSGFCGFDRHLDSSVRLIFDLLNGAQGAFIFIFHCLTYNKVRKEYRRALGKADWMPSCCRQCLLLLLGAAIHRQVASLTGTGTSCQRQNLAVAH